MRGEGEHRSRNSDVVAVRIYSDRIASRHWRAGAFSKKHNDTRRHYFIAARGDLATNCSKGLTRALQLATRDQPD